MTTSFHASTQQPLGCVSDDVEFESGPTLDGSDITSGESDGADEITAVESEPHAPTVPEQRLLDQLVLDELLLERRLTVGCSGNVYEAVDRDGASRIVKLVSGVFLDSGDRNTQYPKVLARIHASRHPALVSILRWGRTSDGRLFIVMPAERGCCDLRADMADHGRYRARALHALGRALLSGTAALHARGLVHGDIKPGNCLVRSRAGAGESSSGEATSLRIIDFGAARIADPAEAGVCTLRDEGIGTPAYLAPERQTGRIGFRSDLYSAGAVLFEVATGVRPFGDLRGEALATAHREQPAPVALEIEPSLPAGIHGFFDRALRKDPAERFADAGAMQRVWEEVWRAAA